MPSWFQHSPELRALLDAELNGDRPSERPTSFDISPSERKKGADTKKAERRLHKDITGLLRKYGKPILGLSLTAHVLASEVSGHPSKMTDTSHESRNASDEAVRDFLGKDELAIPEEPSNKDVHVKIARLRKNAKERAEPMVFVRGFEESFGIPNEDIGRLIAETYPESWQGAGAIDRVSVVDVIEDIEEGEYVQADAICIPRGSLDLAGEIRIRKDCPVERIPQVLQKALIYANDWKSEAIPNTKDRVDFLKAVAKRVMSAGRIPFSSIEDQEGADQARMYWAELLSLAMSVSADDKTSWEKRIGERIAELHLSAQGQGTSIEFDPALDIQLIESYFKSLSDDEFTPWESAKKREDLIHETRAHMLERSVSEDLAGFPKELRARFVHLLHSVNEEVDDRRAMDLYHEIEGDLPGDIQKYFIDRERVQNVVRASFEQDQRSSLLASMGLTGDAYSALRELLLDPGLVDVRAHNPLNEVRELFKVIAFESKSWSPEDIKTITDSLSAMSGGLRIDGLDLPERLAERMEDLHQKEAV